MQSVHRKNYTHRERIAQSTKPYSKKHKLIFALVNRILYAKNRPAIEQYRSRNKKLPNVAAPSSYPEMMLWRKLVDHNPQFVCLSDKLATKKYIERVCPEAPLPRTLWVGDNADDIPDSLLERDVIVKSSHGFNQNIEVRDAQVDRASLKKTTDQWLGSVHGTQYFEWAYSQVKPRLFVEEIIGNAAKQLLEVSITSHNGKPNGGVVIGQNKLPDMWIAFMDLPGREIKVPGDDDWQPILFSKGIDIAVPYQLALEYTRKLSVDIDYARFDFMWNGEQLFAGEITIYPGGGINNPKHPEVKKSILYDWDLRTSHYVRTARHGFKRLYAAALKEHVLKQREIYNLTSGSR